MERETGIAKLMTLAGLGFVDAKEGGLKLTVSVYDRRKYYERFK